MEGTRSLLVGSDLMLYGVIDASGFGDEIRSIDVISSLKALKANAVNVRINSPGGSVSEGIAIYNALRADGRKIIVNVDSVAASIASVIALAGDEIVIADNASIMIHDPWSIVAGSSNDMRKMADEIDRMRAIILDTYEKRTKLSRAEISAMMEKETWMGAEEAVAKGFAHRIEQTLAIAACAELSHERFAALLIRDFKNSLAQTRATKTAVSAKIKEATLADPKTAGEAPAILNIETPPAVNIDADAIRADAIKAERERVSKIQAAVRNARLEPSFADVLINDGVDVNAANARIIDAIAERSPAIPHPQANHIAVIRDGGETRMEAMEESLSLRLGVKGEPSAAARQYMDYGIADMAAERLGHRGRLTTVAQRESVIRNAMHTTSDFPALLENTLNKVLAARYQLVQPTYREISRQRNYLDFRPHIAIKMGDFPALQAVGEGGEVRSGTFSETKEFTSAGAYGIQVGFSRQLLVNDNLGGIQQVLQSRADMVAQWEERQFYSMLLSASGAGPTLNETGRAVFNATDNTKASSGAAIAIATLSDARKAVRTKKTLDGLTINAIPSILLVGPAQETLAQQFTSNAYVPTAQGSINPFTGILRVIVSAQITDNSWYVFAEPSTIANFEWGLLDGYTAPRFRMEEPFGQQGMRVSLEHDWGAGAIDYRGAWLNPGT